MAVLIDGNAVSAEIRQNIKDEISALREKTGKVPGLAVILVGEDPASQVYVNMKIRNCEELGIKSFAHILPAHTSEKEVLDLLKGLNDDCNVNGILVQLPLPKHIDEKKVIYSINPEKDVDGFHPVNVGKLVIGGSDDGFLPCTPYGCQVLINRYVSDIKGKHLVIVGRSNLVGKPLANIMLQKNKNADCVVTVCHSSAKDLSVFTREADILVAAVGSRSLIKADMVKDGVVVIDVGTSRVNMPDGKSKLAGDVDYENVSKKASAITPVPGGVGPMTRAMLMSNTLKAFKCQNFLI